jgi:cyclomaltodextrinase / maltogenic alpha-amylase / neopullulanase
VDDFIFGTLATEELRLSHVRARSAGVTHYQARFPRDPLPDQPITFELIVGPANPGGLPALERAWLYWSVDGLDPQGEMGRSIHGQAIEMEPAGVEWDTFLWGYIRRFRVSLPGLPEDTTLRYRLSAANGREEVFADGGAYYACYIAGDPLPDWTREAIVYQIFVDRFYPGGGLAWKKTKTLADFFGGTLQGIVEKLDYISSLGANVLWLSPIFPSPSHHGYDATDYFEVEPRLGTKEDLRLLLDEAHTRNIRVLLDFVPNHWSHLHPTFQDAIKNQSSPYRDWYTFSHWPDRYETFFGVRTLPEINLRHPPAREHILNSVSYWLEFGVDGFRVDYAVGPTRDFWADFRRATRKAKAEPWTFGEAVEAPDSQLSFQGGLDGCLDFVLLEAVRQTFAFGRWSAARFTSFLDRHETFFPPDFSRPSFLDNHDMNRFLWVSKGDKRRLMIAALCQFSLSGQPVIYQGTEVGLSQARDIRQGKRAIMEEARQPMLWGEEQDTDLLDFYTRLIALRKKASSLRTGSREVLYVDEDLLVFCRNQASEELVTALNVSQNNRRILIDKAGIKPEITTEAGCTYTRIEGGLELDLPPLSGMMLA